MQIPVRFSDPRRLVLFATAALFVLWLMLHLAELAGTQNGLVRFILTVFFSLLVLLRPKPQATAQPASDEQTRVPALRAVEALDDFSDTTLRSALYSAFTGIMLVVWGLVFNIRQLEWLGMLLTLGGCLRWSLPESHRRDVWLSLFLLYWAHPLPSQIFRPLQFAMQEMSVKGSAWLLHGLSIPVWADGMVLRTGYATYEIPAWCSGMRTATTVFLLSLGLGFVRRIHMLELLILVPAALGQALILNIIRISIMVILSPGMKGRSGVDFLHDTAGIIVLTAILLVYIEILLMGRFKKKLAALRQVTIDQATEHPPFWRCVGTFKWLAVGIAGVVLCWMLLAVKNRPEHRLQMQRNVALAARDADNLEEAELAARAVLLKTPDDVPWRLTTLRILLLREKHEEVLAALADIPEDEKAWVSEKTVLRAYALMALGQVEEAASLVRTLPEDVRKNNPQVGMVLAEMGFHSDDPEAVAQNVPLASQWRPNTERVRRLYPYLRYHRKWETIAESSHRVPFTKPEQAMSALEAYMNLDHAAEMGTTLLKAINRWPRDPRLLEPLFYMAVKRIDSAWEERFADQLRRTTPGMDNVLYLYMLEGRCFELGRPDLAWMILNRMADIDPQHPSIFMSLVNYGDRWMAFRRRFLGLPAAAADELIDFRPYYGFARSLDRWRGLSSQVPFGKDLYDLGPAKARNTFLKAAVAEFGRREARNDLPVELKYEYIRALDLSDDIEGARRVAATLPAEKTEDRILTQSILSELYERRKDWQNAYETSREDLDRDRPELDTMLRRCRSEIELRLGLAALHTAEQAVKHFPHAGQAAAMQAEALLLYDSPEQALFCLNRPTIRACRQADQMEARALYATERFPECETFCKTRLLPRPRDLSHSLQHVRLPPAEVTLLWHRLFIPREKDFTRHTDNLREDVETMTSPFVKGLAERWIACIDAGGKDGTTDYAKWLAVGRDDTEKAVALNQLMLLLCRSERYTEARDAAAIAVKLFPEAYLNWRFLISLSDGNKNVLKVARRQCPTDPEIWLAELVVKTSDTPQGPAEWTEEDVRQQFIAMMSPGRPAFSPATLTRAAEYLMRKGMLIPFRMATEQAVRHSRGLLPAYVLGIRCAIGERDREWALDCTKQAIMASRHPTSALYEKLVALKTFDGHLTPDADVVESLKSLRQSQPDDALWAEMLGYVRFERGGWEVTEAVSHMLDAIHVGSTNRVAYLIAGEASRILGNTDRAGDILRQGSERHPGDLEILNNLTYVLSMNPETLKDAEKLLPILLGKDEDNLHVLDTVSVVLLQAGREVEAEPLLAEIIARSEEGSALRFRAGLHRAQIIFGRGGTQAALDELQRLLRNTREVPDEDMLTAASLLDTIKAHQSDVKAVP